ncbi:glycoside hydrolase family 88/105 protein [Saccharicrinis fermentans]|uniref:Unsaturated rhamnogalacturonyl hydrolase YteR n=1 Tax=Saccharicrinis fermentans DSM 9555 = JCM 21142 TaxID=869213 RepID=W7YH81_9BACT|nr:glycoside hydrolase family 88 protein [Saccharicrinis fermentans]GAF03771.1 unsaturated rhamnogalacturonyl hydrolase YteR [Saccharicrinis fermentans DSM 9555 = JCM 21142]
MMNYIIYISCLVFMLGCQQPNSKKTDAHRMAEEKWSVRMADAVMCEYDSLVYYLNPRKVKWEYDYAFLGGAIDKLGNIDEKYSHYMEAYIDYFVRDDGSIATYKQQIYNIDRINPGKNLITLYKRTGKEKYKKAIEQLVKQMEEQPKTKSGGYWHKKVYPYQMWLDGIYMASPFLAQYAKEFNKPAWFDKVTFQIQLIYAKTKDESSGLLYHAWDESREQKWSNPDTGCSPHFWSRAMGWYVMAIVDVLDFLPENHEDRAKLVRILQETCDAIVKVRDGETGLWYQVLDQANREGNYLEGSGSAMFTYVFAKGANKGYLKPAFLALANESFNGMVEHLIANTPQGTIEMRDICGGCGLGGDPYRDGSFEYYITEKKVINDTKGVAPFILAAIELDR